MNALVLSPNKSKNRIHFEERVPLCIKLKRAPQKCRPNINSSFTPSYFATATKKSEAI